MMLRICIAALTLSITACSRTPHIRSSNGQQPLAHIERIILGGYPQWVLIRSHNIHNPVLLLLHGGPGASETGMFRKYNSELERYFTVVYWDQRGAGKSYSKELDISTLTLKQLIADTKELTEHLKKRFEQKKIFLLGHSWGSRLGLYVIRDQPQNFYAFVGIGQDLASHAGDSLSYVFTLNQARELGLKKAIRELESSGPPPYEFWHGVRQKHWLLKVGGERYNRKNYLDWIFGIWFSPEYTFFDLFRWSNGSATTAGHMLNDPSFTPFDVRKEITAVNIPVFFISGIRDYNTPIPLVKEFYETLKAPHKEFIVFEKSAHSPPFEEPDKFNQVIIEKLLPLAAPGRSHIPRFQRDQR